MHASITRRLVPLLAVAGAIAATAPVASAQIGTPPYCDPSFNLPAPGTGPEWQPRPTDPAFNQPAPGTGPEWQTDLYGPEWYSGVPCSDAAPAATPIEETPISRTVDALFGLLRP